MRHKRFWFWMLAGILTLNLAIGFSVYSVEARRNGETEAFDKVSVMMRVLYLLRKDYVSAEKVDFTELIYSALRGMVGSLDPFSAFMTPDEYRDMMESTEGEFGGLGIMVTVQDGILTIVTPMEDTPGFRAGLMAGDRIVRINGESTKDMTLSECVQRLKGAPGTRVVLTIYRPSQEKEQDYEIERATIPVVSVKDVTMLEERIGYLRIIQFNEPTADRVQEALEQLLNEDAQALVLDLRNNPGGLLDSAVDVCSLFLPAKSVIVSTEGRQPSQKREYQTSRERVFPDRPVAILINRGSASAAEIVAGCLQDTKRGALLVGERTFGKGSVQNVIELPDGSALRLTTAMYYTPSRRVIHEHGIEPDIEVKLTDDELRGLITRQMAAGKAPDMPAAVDRQLQRAVDALKVYMQARGSRS